MTGHTLKQRPNPYCGAEIQAPDGTWLWCDNSSNEPKSRADLCKAGTHWIGSDYRFEAIYFDRTGKVWLRYEEYLPHPHELIPGDVYPVRNVSNENDFPFRVVVCDG